MNKFIIIPILLYTANTFSLEKKDYAMLTLPVIKTGLSSCLAVYTISNEIEYQNGDEYQPMILSMIYGIPNALLIANVIQKNSRGTKIFRNIVLAEELIFASVLFFGGIYGMMNDETGGGDGILSGFQSALGASMVAGSVPMFVFSLISFIPYGVEKNISLNWNIKRYADETKRHALSLNYLF